MNLTHIGEHVMKDEQKLDADTSSRSRREKCLIIVQEQQ